MKTFSWNNPERSKSPLSPEAANDINCNGRKNVVFFYKCADVFGLNFRSKLLVLGILPFKKREERMNRVTRQMGRIASTSGFRAMLGISLFALFFVYACGKDNGTGSSSYQCEVTLTLVPSRIGNLSSPSGIGRGTGMGATQQEAVSAAYRAACSQLNLSSDLRRTCESGRNFGVAVTTNGVTLVSAVERSQQCSGSTSN